MSLRLADENAVRGSEKADTKQAAVAKVDIRSKSRKLADENVSHAHGKNSKVPEKPEKRVPKHPENKKQNSEATKDSALDIVDRICDIDADDGEYLEFCSKYVKKIYDHLFLEEAEHPVRKDYLQLYADLRPSMRGILIEWLVFLQNRFRLLQDTLLMAVSIMDRMLSTKKAKITRQNFQLLGATCLWIAAKYEEMYHPSVNDFVFACADYYTRLDFRTMETHILTTLGFQFSKPLSSHFLRRFSKAAGGDTETHQTAKYLIELSLYAYDLVDSLPSVIAAAALFVAGRATGKIPSWSRILQFYSRYKPENFRLEALKIAEIAVNPLKDSYLKTTVEKYSKTKVQSNTQLFTNDFLVELSRSLANA